MKFEHLVGDRKTFAVAVKDSKYKQFLFKLCTDKNYGTHAMLIETCKNGCRTQASTVELKEFLGFTIASIHNLAFYLWLVKQARKHILEGDFLSWKNEMVPLLKTRL